MRKPQISRYKEKIEEFCKKYYITRLALFGSILTRNFKATSDVDFLVKFDKKHIPSLFDFVDMQMELGEIIGCKADLKTAEDISHYFRNSVTSQAKTIYEQS